MPRLPVRHELARHICARVRGQSNTGGRRAASGRQHCLRECSRSGVARNPSYGRSRLSGSGVMRDYRALERVSQPRAESMLVRRMIVKILVQSRRDAVFHRPAYRVTRKSGPYPFGEPGSPLPVLARMIHGLPNRSPGEDSCSCPFPYHRLSPVLPIRVLEVLNRAGHGCQQKQHDPAFPDPHDTDLGKSFTKGSDRY